MSTLGISYVRSDQPRAVVSKSIYTSDEGRLEGPGRKTLPAGDGSTEYELWTGENNANGSAFTAKGFNKLVIVVDPDDLLAEDDPDRELGVWILEYYTAIAGGASTSTGIRRFVPRGSAYVVPSSIAASGVTITREITKVTAFNANADNDLVVQCVLEVPEE